MLYRTQAKIISLVEQVICLIGLMGIFIIGITFAIEKESLQNDEQVLKNHPQLRDFIESSPTEQSLYFVVPALYLTGELIVAGLLYVGAEKSRQSILKIWMVLTVTISVLGLAICFFGILSIQEKTLAIVLAIGSYLFTFYSIWVGHKLLKANSLSLVDIRE